MKSGDPRLSPCFIPARLRHDGAEHDVNLTRIGADRARASTDASMQVGDRIELELNRPTDGRRVLVTGRVKSVRPDGGSAGWAPSVEIVFDQPIGEAMELEPAGTSAPYSGEISEDGVSRESFTLEELMPPEPMSLEDDSDDDLPMLQASAWEDLSEDSTHPWEGLTEDSVLRKDPFTRVSGEPQDPSFSMESASGDATLPPDGTRSEEGELPDPESLASDETSLDWRPGHGVPRRETATIPWLDDPDAVEELDDRETRVISEVSVSFMVAGDRHAATVQDFGPDGLFLALAPTEALPEEGAMMRIEFPVVTLGDVRYVRLFAEVRWTHGEGDPETSGRGVGARIVDYESPVERQIYEHHVQALLEDLDSPSSSSD